MKLDSPESAMRKIFCNPLNLDYKYQHPKKGRYAYREAADPTLVYFKDRYYLFASMSGGFWYSFDLIDWRFHENKDIPVYYYAPDVEKIGEYLYISGSRKTSRCPILRTKDPLSDEWQYVGKPLATLDPCFFADDNGKVYLYHGSSPKEPLKVAEVDSRTMRPLHKMKSLFGAGPEKIGWERTDKFCGGPHIEEANPMIRKIFGGSCYIEGSYMTKYNGIYYLQYGAPATEVDGYGDGVYTAQSPIGPFEMQIHNPFSSVPGGFIRGAGHGSIVKDRYENYWHISTMCVCVNAAFERRIGMFPCGFDEEGILFCNQNFADYPQEIKEGKIDLARANPLWMLLSYKKKVYASSYVTGYEPQLAVNESIKDRWRAAKAEPGEWLILDLEEIYDIRGVQINFSDVDVPVKKYDRKQYGGELTQKRHIDMETKLYLRYLLEYSVDGEKWEIFVDKKGANTNLCHDYIACEEGKNVRYLRLTSIQMPYNQPMSVSGFRVFGRGKGSVPEKVMCTVKRKGSLDASLSWKRAEGAIGYNVRYGIAQDKLYSSWLVYESTSLELPMLNAVCRNYYFCVDSFNENGVQIGETIVSEW